MTILKNTLYVFLLILLSTSNAFSSQDIKKFSGHWQCSMTLFGINSGTMNIVFNDNGQGSMSGQLFTYRVLPDAVLRFNSSGEISDYDYQFQQDQLQLKYQDGSIFNCVKQAASTRANDMTPGAGNMLSAGSGNEWQLQGAFCNWSGSSSYSSSYSSTRSIYFDGSGRWTFSSQSSFSGNAGSAYSGQGSDDGGSYRVEGKRIVYTSATGEQGVAMVNMRQNDGSISEIMLGNALYAKSLCH